jgi:uncharacterized protein
MDGAGREAGTVTWRVLSLSMPLGAGEEELRRRACERAGISPGDLASFRIARRSLDLRDRRKGRPPSLVHHLDLVLRAGTEPAALKRAVRSGRVVRAPLVGCLGVERVHASLEGKHAVVVGSGPAGAFGALVLALAGVRVSLLERGARLDQRGRHLAGFHRRRELNPESNLLFGEGGAGTYSDGKIYTRIDDPLEVPVLEELVRAGAPEDLLYDARAHIGTDKLHRLLPRLRERMQQHGVSFHFDTRLEALVLDGAPGDGERRVRAVRTSAGELPCDLVLFAPGHSARDTWQALHGQGVAFESKPFQLGLRVEHPQALIDQGRYGDPALRAALGAASYQLVCKAGAAASGAHTFCMCPGGKIVASINEPGLLCTNGMSNSSHSSPWANAAVVATFTEEHFGPGPFAAVALQRALERRFFEAGGADYTAPAQTVPDFLAGRTGAATRHSSYPFGTVPARLDELLPPHATAALARALLEFERRIPGFAGPEGLLVGLESRSSGPLRMPRDPVTRRAQGFINLYPVGEGAGFAGGITSAAIDGARSAQTLLRTGIARA